MQPSGHISSAAQDRETPQNPVITHPKAPGRPRLDTKYSEQDERRRKQLRSAQDRYRSRKQKEISMLTSQNIRLQHSADMLGESLVALLDQVEDAQVLRQNSAFARQTVTTIRDMLQLVQNMQDDDTIQDNTTMEDDTNIHTQDLSLGKITLPRMPTADRNQEISTASMIREVSDKQLNFPHISYTRTSTLRNEGNITFSTDLEHLDNIQLYSNRDPTSLTTQSIPTGPFGILNWFAASSWLSDRELDPYAISSHTQAPFAVRLDHSALLRASWILQDPNTDMDVVHKIFPFEYNPAPPHKQLLKINRLLNSSNPQYLGVGSGPNNSSSSINMQYSQQCVEDPVNWDDAYALWLSAYDLERYLVERWRISRKGDHFYIRWPMERVFSNTSKSGNIRPQGEATGRDKYSLGSHSEVHLQLRISDLIKAFIQDGICLGSIPAFNRKLVDDIVTNLAQEQWSSAIMK